MMMIKFLYRLLISGLFCLILQNGVLAETYVSISPAMTEIVYALNIENRLLGVSTRCKYPDDAKNKEKVGDNFFINTEKILKIKPDYILALDSSEFMLNKFKRFKIKPLCFKYPDIESIYENILAIGKLSGREKRAEEIVQFSKKKIELARKQNKNPKNILYLADTMPMISIGKGSFINDIIEKSGHKSVTSELKTSYPVIMEEYAVLKNPDIIILSIFADDKRIRRLFPDTKIIRTTSAESDIINRPGPRIYKAVEFFAKL